MAAPSPLSLPSSLFSPTHFLEQSSLSANNSTSAPQHIPMYFPFLWWYVTWNLQPQGYILRVRWNIPNDSRSRAHKTYWVRSSAKLSLVIDRVWVCCREMRHQLNSSNLICGTFLISLLFFSDVNGNERRLRGVMLRWPQPGAPTLLTLLPTACRTQHQHSSPRGQSASLPDSHDNDSDEDRASTLGLPGHTLDCITKRYLSPKKR